MVILFYFLHTLPSLLLLNSITSAFSGLLGVVHADELQYLFHPSSALNLTWSDLEANSADDEFSHQLVSLWALFATEG